jgi:hypothetical protein
VKADIGRRALPALEPGFEARRREAGRRRAKAIEERPVKVGLPQAEGRDQVAGNPEFSSNESERRPVGIAFQDPLDLRFVRRLDGESRGARAVDFAFPGCIFHGVTNLRRRRRWNFR